MSASPFKEEMSHEQKTTNEIERSTIKNDSDKKKTAKPSASIAQKVFSVSRKSMTPPY